MADTELATEIEAAAGQEPAPAAAQPIESTPVVRLLLQSAAGSESVTLGEPNGFDKAMLNDCANRLSETEIHWTLGHPGVVAVGADNDLFGDGTDALKMVVRWTN